MWVLPNLRQHSPNAATPAASSRSWPGSEFHHVPRNSNVPVRYICKMSADGSKRHVALATAHNAQLLTKKKDRCTAMFLVIEAIEHRSGHTAQHSHFNVRQLACAQRSPVRATSTVRLRADLRPPTL